jgi:hypothetical protein
MEKLVPGVNDLGNLNPGLATELVDPSQAVELSESSMRKPEWCCKGSGDKPHPYFTWSATVTGQPMRERRSVGL